MVDLKGVACCLFLAKLYGRFEGGCWLLVACRLYGIFEGNCLLLVAGCMLLVGCMVDFTGVACCL